MLVVPERKTVLLHLKDPDPIVTLIPGARKGKVRGHEIVAVPHTHDTVRVLRNVGIKVPSPIEHYYPWPGRFKPFIHQRETASFAGLNPRAYILNGMGCIAGDDKVRVSRCGKSMEMPLRMLHEKFHKLPDKTQWKARSLKGDRFGMNELEDVLYKGEQPTLRFLLADGMTFRCTADHRIARPDGTWSEARQLRVGDALVTNGQVEIPCIKCGVPRLVKESSARFSRNKPCLACKHKAHSVRMAGERNPAWTGGRFIDSDGYVRVWLPEHHRADNNGYVFEHILVAEAKCGHPVTVEYHVHHENKVRHDNRPGNLEVMPAKDHHRLHAKLEALDRAITGKGGEMVVLPRTSEIVYIGDGGTVDVYDLCMRAPHHNFVVNGVVVHNSGKTVAVLWAYDYLRKAGLVDWLFVISPLSTLERAWGDEIFRNFPDMSFGVLHGDKAKRMKLLMHDFDAYVINHDGIKNKELLAAVRAKPGRGLFVVDELAEFRNSSTDRWKALNWLINGHKRKVKGVEVVEVPPVEWAWGLTGTPIPKEPTDAWAQCRIITPWAVPGYFGAFRDDVMRKVSMYKWVPRVDALEKVHRVMQPAIRFAREDCIDLPPTTSVRRDIELTDEQRKLYKEMLARFKAEYAGGQITAANEAVKIGKLLQIVLGVAYGPQGEEIIIPSGPRFEELMRVIEESASKTIVFVPLTGALDQVAASVAKHYSVRVVQGATPKAQRDQIFHEFQHGRDPQVLVAQPGCMAHGLSFTAASTTCWYGPIHSANIYQQANERTPRPGQKLNTLIVNLQGSAVERAMYDKLERRESTQNVLLEMFKG